MIPRERQLWAILESRDDTLQAVKRTYEGWLSDLQREVNATKAYLAEVEADRTARLAAINDSNRVLEESATRLANMEAHIAKLTKGFERQIAELHQALAGAKSYIQESETDRTERLKTIQELQAQLDLQGTKIQNLESSLVIERGNVSDLALQRQALTKELEAIKAYVATAEGAHENRLKALDEMQEQLKAQGLARHQAEAKAKELAEELKGTSNYLRAVEDDRAQRLKALAEMQLQLEECGRSRHATESRVIELEQTLRGTREYLCVVERDRDARLAAISELQASLAHSQASLNQQIATIQSDSEKRLASIIRLQAQLDDHGKARHLAESRVAQLEQALQGTSEYLRAVENDRDARLSVITDLQGSLDQNQKAFSQEVAAIQADRAERLEAIKKMQAQLDEHGNARHIAESRVAELEQALKGTKDYLDLVEKDRDARLTAILSLQSTLDKIAANSSRNAD